MSDKERHQEITRGHEYVRASHGSAGTVLVKYNPLDVVRIFDLSRAG